MLTGPGELFDACYCLETQIASQIHPDIARVLNLHRTVAGALLLSKHYKDEYVRDPAKIPELMREETIARKLLQMLPDLRTTLPAGRFGPGTLREIAPPDFIKIVGEFVYSLEHDAEDWSGFQRLLPTDLRERFNPMENGIEVPDVLNTLSEAKELLERISERKGIPIETLLDPGRFAEHCKSIHGFALAMDFFAAQAKLLKQESSKPPSP
jgi:hypothetical protein